MAQQRDLDVETVVGERSATALDRSIDTQVSRLRRKLEKDATDPNIIKTVWGGGYMFTPAVKHE